MEKQNTQKHKNTKRNFQWFNTAAILGTFPFRINIKFTKYNQNVMEGRRTNNNVQ